MCQSPVQVKKANSKPEIPKLRLSVPHSFMLIETESKSKNQLNNHYQHVQQILFTGIRTAMLFYGLRGED